jgi:hypothetical protein
MTGIRCSANLGHDHADRDSHPADAWLAAHDRGMLCDSGKLAHVFVLFKVLKSS